MTDTTCVKTHRVPANGRSTTSVVTLTLAAVLLVAAIVLGFSMLNRMKESVGSVLHTYSVRSEIGTLHIDSADLAAMVASAALNDSSSFRNPANQLAEEEQTLKDLRVQTRDNPLQQQRLQQLVPLLDATRSQLSACSTDLHCLPSLTPYQQEFLRSLYERHQKILAILDDMDTEEKTLLEHRLSAWSRRFGFMVLALAISFLSAAFLVLFNFRVLLKEIDRRKRSEKLIREHVDSYRALSGRILELQDSERRKIARELHDSIGQYLAGLKLQVRQIERLVSTNSGTQALLSETSDLLDRCLAEVRTISHLLHPPLLDELGLYSAARWYVDGFAERSGLQVDFVVDDFADRLHKDAEIALFRVLQEALINVHRHAGAKRVQIDIRCKNEQAVLLIKDDGHGIPPEILRRYQEGHGGGIGLAGMRERLAELGGNLTVDSSPSGTVLRASLPTNAGHTPRPESSTTVLSV